MASTTGTIFTLTRNRPPRTNDSLTASPFFPLHLLSCLAYCIFDRRAFCRLFRCVSLRRISRQENLIHDHRKIAQTSFRKKINKGLGPVDIKTRMIGPHPVILHTGLKSIPKILSRCGLLWTFFIHKSYPIQVVNLQLTVLC